MSRCRSHILKSARLLASISLVATILSVTVWSAGVNATTDITAGATLKLEANNVASYPGTGSTWTDLAGTPLNATIAGVPAYSATDGGQIVLDGTTNQYISLPDNDGIKLNTTSARTIQVWVKPSLVITNPTNSRGSTILSKQTAAYDYDGYHLYLTNTGYLEMSTNGRGASQTTISTTQPMSINTWYLVTFVSQITHTAGSTKLYVNTTEVISGAHGVGTIDESNPLWIGKDGTGTAANFKGSIGAVYAYDSALSAAEITANYNATSTRGAISDTTAPTLSSSTPADDATGVAIDANIVLNFSETVTAVASKNVVLYKSDGTIIETIAATDTTKVTVSTSTVTVNPAATLTNSIEYYILIDSGAFKDVANNVYTGITSSTALSFTTVAETPTTTTTVTPTTTTTVTPTTTTTVTPTTTTTVTPTTTTTVTPTTTTTLPRTRTITITGAEATYEVFLTNPSLTATPSVGAGSVSWQSLTPDVCTLAALFSLSDVRKLATTTLNQFTVVGTCTIQATVASTDIYDAATATVSFEITKHQPLLNVRVRGSITNMVYSSTATFTSIEGETVTFWGKFLIGTHIPLSARSTASLRFVNNSPSVCSLTTPTAKPSGAITHATFIKAGECSVDAVLPYSSLWKRTVASTEGGAADASLIAQSRTLRIDSSSYQSTYSYDATPPTITASPSAGKGLISFYSATISVCAIDSDTGSVTVRKAGTCVVGAQIEATLTHLSATASPVRFAVELTPPSTTTMPTTTTNAPTTTTPTTTTNAPTKTTVLMSTTTDAPTLESFTPLNTSPTTTSIASIVLDDGKGIVLLDDVTQIDVSAFSLIQIAKTLNVTSGQLRVRTTGEPWQSMDVNDITSVKVAVGPATLNLEIEFITDGQAPIQYFVPLSVNKTNNPWIVPALVFTVGLLAMSTLAQVGRRRRRSNLPPPPPPTI